MPVIPFNMVEYKAAVRRLPGVKFCMGGGAGATWTDELGGVNMTLQGGATHNGEFATFDGSLLQFARTAGVPGYWTGFSGTSATRSWNGSGITIGGVIRVAPGDLESRTICHFKNTGAGLGDETRWMGRIESDGCFRFWNQYWNDTNPSQLDPVAFGTIDRSFKIPVDLRPYLADGRFHTFLISRGTDYYDSAPESKLIVIDGIVRYGPLATGNFITGFRDFDVPSTFGKSEMTTIFMDPMFGHFKGDAGCWFMANAWCGAPAAVQLHGYAAGFGDNRSSRSSRGRT